MKITARLASFAAAMSLGISSLFIAAPSQAASTSSIPAPSGLPSFYSVPQPLPTKAGVLIKVQKVTDQNLVGSMTGGTLYRVMYTSTGFNHSIVPVTGMVVVPTGATPSGGWPVISWGHGTNGMADVCAPSTIGANEIPEVNKLLTAGYVVTASDYQGEGTPGLLPYIVGYSAAHNTVDIVRAARQMAIPGVTISKNYVVWGHSEGGQTAMFSLYDPSYAPTLNLKGVVAGAPPSQFKYIYDFLKTSPFDFYLLMAAGSYNSYYGSDLAPLDAVVTKAAQSLLPTLDQGCSGYVKNAVDQYVASTPSKKFAALIPSNPFDNPKWSTLLTLNDPNSFATPTTIPLLIIQGALDEQIPVVSTELLKGTLCKIGQPVRRWVYSGQSHAGVISPSADDMIHWINDRFTSSSARDPYVPTADGNQAISIARETC